MFSTGSVSSMPTLATASSSVRILQELHYMLYQLLAFSICSHGLRQLLQFFTQNWSVVTTCTNCTSHVWYGFKSVSHAFTDIITWLQWPYDRLIANNLNATRAIEKIIKDAMKHWIIEWTLTTFVTFISKMSLLLPSSVTEHPIMDQNVFVG